MAVYRANLLKIEAAADGSLHADVRVELRTALTPVPVWQEVSGGHFTIVLTSEEVMAAINNPANTTAVLKRKALQDIIKTRALARGVDKADEAYAEWIKLMPTYPVEIVVRQ